jgi:hypothetical protein
MRLAVFALTIALAACAPSISRVMDLPTGGRSGDTPFQANRGSAPPPPAAGAGGRQSAPPEGKAVGGVDFGRWRQADPVVYSAAFEEQMAQRYANSDRARARADLERNGFACAEQSAALVCRIEIMENQCAKDWYVALENGRDRPRAGFDVMCLGAR